MKAKQKEYRGTLTRDEMERLPKGFTPIYRTSPKWFIKKKPKTTIINNRKKTNGRPLQIVYSSKTNKLVKIPLLTKAYLAINAFFKKQQNSK